MRIIVIGDTLENYLYEIVISTEKFGCNTLFFKKNIDTKIISTDILVIDSRIRDILPQNIKNTVISVVFDSDYLKIFENEFDVTFTSIRSIEAIVEKTMNFCDLPIAIDQASMNVFRIADKIASTDATVLITGETGTGKEVLAKYIHRFSDRSNQKFIAINCAAIPDALLESELFGHERGAFTNAIQKRIGKFEEAHLGTILLDEISEMPLSLQAKLLRVIQEREFSRLGGNSSVNVDIRIIATSNKNLRKAVSEGVFREDLFYRLNVIPIEMPTLSERPLDIIPLAIFFCKKYSHSKKKLSAKMLHLIKNRKWNGNIRELENFVHRVVIFSSEKTIDIDNVQFDTFMRDIENDFSENSQQEDNVLFIDDDNPTNDSQKTLAEIEKEAILNALEKFNGDKNLVSKALDIPIRTLRYKLNSYKIVA